MQKYFHTICFCFFILLIPGFAVAQATAPPINNTLIGAYRAFKLGMDIDQVKKILKEDVYFNYRGDPDVSFLPITEEPLIECAGNSYIERAYFQFNEKKLFIITLVLDTTKLDYYTLFTSLTAKYGKSTALSPELAVWEFNEVRISLERPLSVKYIATEVFNSLKANNKGEADYLSLSKKEFLEQF